MPDHTILLQFLENPGDRRVFGAFYEQCFHIARGYLAGLAREGWRLPLDQYATDTALDDCTIDAMITLFRSANGRFPLIHDYFAGKTGSRTPPEKMLKMLYGLIGGHIRQEVYRIRRDTQEQAFKLRKQIRLNLKSDAYELCDRRGVLCCRWRSARDGLREALAPADGDLLEHWIVLAAQRSRSTPDRCRTVFAHLDQDDRFRNFLVVHRLVSCMIRVLLDDFDTTPSEDRPVSAMFVLQRIRCLANRAVADTLRNVFEPLAVKRSLAIDVKEAYHRALRNMMMDFSTHGEHDALPGYLYEQIDLDSAAYLKEHKHVWETCVARCKERLRELLRYEGLAPERESGA